MKFMELDLKLVQVAHNGFILRENVAIALRVISKLFLTQHMRTTKYKGCQQSHNPKVMDNRGRHAL